MLRFPLFPWLLLLTVNTLPMQQLGQLPMFYFSSFHQVYKLLKPRECIAKLKIILQKSRFAAEKFCALHGLILGMPQDEMSALLDLLPGKI